MAIVLATLAPSGPGAAQVREEPTQRDKLLWTGVGGEIAQFNGDEDAPGLEQSWGQVVLYTAMPEIGFTEVVPAYRYIGETARTDKQVGSTAKSRGTTSLLEKPGIPEMIAVAVERGAIEREENGTSYTLRSSPAVLFRILHRGEGGRIPEDEPEYAWLERVGASVTMPGEQSDSDEDLSEITEWSIQLNLNFWGDRTVDSPRFHDEWAKAAVPAIERELEARSGIGREFYDMWPEMAEVRKPSMIRARGAVRELLAKDAASFRGIPTLRTADEVRAHPAAQRLFDAARQAVEAEIALRIREKELNAPPEVIEMLQLRLPQLTKARLDYAGVTKMIDEELEKVLRVPVFTAGYSNHKAEIGPNFSEVKLLLQHRLDLSKLRIFPEPFDLIWNANVSLNHHADRAVDQETVRDYSGGLGAEFRFDNPFAGLLGEGDRSYITWLLAARVARIESAEAVAAFAQTKIEIPIAAGLSIPLSVTYATRSEENQESEIRGNLGFTVDFDKIYALAALALGR